MKEVGPTRGDRHEDLRKAQHAKAAAFRAMHTEGPMLRLTNAWNRTSARIQVAAGAHAVGTTSFGVSIDNGAVDGEGLAWPVMLSIAADVARAVDVPVSVDLEAGRGQTPTDVARSVTDVVACGAVGVNIEDAIPGQPGQLFSVADQTARLAAARGAADDAGIPLFLNARCDVYFGAATAPEDRLDAVLGRAEAYRSAGADGLFLPGLVDLEIIRTVTTAVGLPLNVMVWPGLPGPAALEAAGARRVSQGADAFVAVAGVLGSLTERYLAGDLASPSDASAVGLSLLPALMR